MTDELEELRDAAREYVQVVAGWFDFTDTDAYDELNAALAHADSALQAAPPREDGSRVNVLERVAELAGIEHRRIMNLPDDWPWECWCKRPNCTVLAALEALATTSRTTDDG